MKFTIKALQDTYDLINEDLLKLGQENGLALQSIKTKYLGKSGLVKSILKDISSQAKENKALYGKEANELKSYIEEKIGQIENAEIQNKVSQKIDVTAPFDINIDPANRPTLPSEPGHQHPLTQELSKILDIFYRMGFNVEESRQLDDDYHMFESLNFPPGHPARDNWDTFWTEEGLIPPAHTSTMQNRVLKKYSPPIRVVIPGRCFRNEATDPSHEHTLHQIEGVYVDKKVSVGDMLGTIKTYLEAYYETELKIKVQPAFFPFTEPSMEFVMSCPFCKQTGCSTCGHKGWIEIMGCGMIHPNVLKEGGIDPNNYSGFAWGFGLDRVVMIKHAIKDIRGFHSGDIEFLKQF